MPKHTIDIYGHEIADLDDKILTKACQAILDFLRVQEKLSFSIKFMMDPEIQVLNRDYRDKDAPTNVLSFWNDDQDDPYIGDIAISVQTIMREASEQNKSYEDHMIHMLVHGLLHLLGYDHIDEDEAEEMEALEVEILSSMGIENPYN